MQQTTPILAALAFAAAAVAQPVVSPLANATVEGTSSSTVPFTAAYHVLQLHGDLRASGPRPISSISFRRDGVSTSTTGMSRTIDMELFVGDGIYPNAQPLYAANYVGTPTTAVARRSVSTPNWQTAPVTPPSPFDFTIAFDAPYVYLGQTDFVWEIIAYANSGGTTDSMRADATLSTTAQAGGAILGTACRVTGQTQDYQLLGSLRASANGELLLIAQGNSAPPNEPLHILLLGVSNPNLTVPGLCGPVVSSGEIVLPMPATGTTPLWTSTMFTFPHDPWTVGARLYEQAVSYDAGQAGLPLALTFGREFVIPAPITGNVAKVRRVAAPLNITLGSVADTSIVVQLN